MRLTYHFHRSQTCQVPAACRISSSLSEEIFLTKDFTEERVLLHFGAVDRVCDVYLNERYLGHHEGGYLGFTYDITGIVNREGENRLIVSAVDRLSCLSLGRALCRRNVVYSGFRNLEECLVRKCTEGIHRICEAYSDMTGFEIEVTPAGDWNSNDVFVEIES